MSLSVTTRLSFAAAGFFMLPLAALASPALDQQFSAVIELLNVGQAQEAFKALEQLREDAPDYQLATRLYTQLEKELQSRRSPERQALELAALVEESRLRFESEQAVPAEGAVPDAILQLGNSTRRLILVDLPHARLYVLENDGGTLKLLRNHYASMGKKGWGKQFSGDQRTPVGLYYVTGWIDDAELPDLYGSGALPLNYPNFWDQLQHRTGHGIWLHGVPRATDSRAPRSSEGCVTMANADLSALRPFIEPGQTPILLSDAVNWVQPDEASSLRDELLQQMDAWRIAWMDRDAAAYLSHYDEEFQSDGMGRKVWGEQKRRVNDAKDFILVEFEELSLIRYPGSDDNLVLAEFKQRYRSDNFDSDTRKQMFWRRDGDGQWKILREEEQP